MRKITHTLIVHCADGCGAIRCVIGRESAMAPFDRETSRDVAKMVAEGFKVETVTLEVFNAIYRERFDKCLTPKAPDPVAVAMPLFDGHPMEEPKHE